MAAKRDDNRIPVSMGVTDDASLTPTELPIDPVTGRLLIEIVDISAGAPTATNRASRDGNYATASMGVTDDVDLTPEALITHNGYLAVDIA